MSEYREKKATAKKEETSNEVVKLSYTSLNCEQIILYTNGVHQLSTSNLSSLGI